MRYILTAHIFTLLCSISWIATCGINKLNTFCFGWSFSWIIGTGVWLIKRLVQQKFEVK